MAACKAIQELVYNHLTMVGQAAKEVAGEVLKEQMEAVEQRVKANLEKIEKFKMNSYRTSLAPLSEEIHEEHKDHKHETINVETSLPFQDSKDSAESTSLLSSSSENTSTTNANSKTLIPQYTRSISMPAANSIIVGAGNVIPIVSLQSLFIDTTETKKLFLRRFVTTQVR